MILLLIASILGAIAYRLGGASPGEFPWLPAWLVRSRTRDIGVPLISLAYLFLTGAWHWSLLPCAVLFYGALTTYWKILNPIFKKPGNDCFWFNYYAHGLGIALAMAPYAYYTGHWAGFWIRAVTLPLAIMAWSLIIPWVDPEEGGRGAFIVASLRLFLI
jgi:hypothetical protein